MPHHQRQRPRALLQSPRKAYAVTAPSDVEILLQVCVLGLPVTLEQRLLHARLADYVYPYSYPCSLCSCISSSLTNSLSSILPDKRQESLKRSYRFEHAEPSKCGVHGCAIGYHERHICLAPHAGSYILKKYL